jgi:hypothetical protein
MMPQNKKLDQNRNFIIKTSLSKAIFFILIIYTLLLNIGYSQNVNPTGNITFEILPPIESASNYSEGLKFLLRVNISSKDSLSNYSIEHNFTNAKVQYPLNCSQQGESTQDGPFSYECNYSFSNLSSKIYNFKLLATDVNNFSNSTENKIFSVQKSNPNITLFVGPTQSDYQCLEGSTVNLKAFILQNEGIAELFFNGSKVASGNNTTPIEFNLQINPVGIYEISLVFNETQNYLAKNITRTINVTAFEFNIVAKQEYPIGAQDGFLLYAPDNSTVSILNYGPKESMLGSFAECKNTLNLSNDAFPKEIDVYCVNKTGEYIISATLTKNNITKTISQKYKIKNSIDISLNSKTSYFKGDEIKLSASATGGILPYNYSWILENGTKIIGNKLNLKYDTSGNYEIRLEVNDKEGNLLQKLFTISINDWYQVQVKVLDPENKSIALAGVSFDDEKEYTNDSGLVSFKLVPNEYEIMVSASGYRPKIMDYEVKKNDTLIIKLEHSDQETNNLSENNEIVLLEPYNNQLLSKGVVYFKANIDVNKDSDCVLYVAEKDSSWFEQIADFDLDSRQNITFNKEFEDGDYKWKVECSYEGSLPFSSEIYSFKLKKGEESNETSLISYMSNTDDEELIDAGRIRSRIDEAYTNLESLDYQDQGPANALNFRNNLDLALRDFERILRDINALQFRRDLSDSEKDKKRNEYQDSLELLEKNTFYDIVVKESKDLVIYPKKEDLSIIAKEYAENNNLQGNLDLKALNDLQNKILIKTTISHVELHYIDERIEEITLIDKEITLTGNTSQKSFLLEYIPKEASQSTDEITMITKGDIIKKDPLLKFPKDSESVVYYIKGTKDLEIVKNSLTILLSEEVFLAKAGIGGNLITGAMVFSLPELSSTAWLVVVLLFILIVYLIYAFDLLDYVKNLFESSKKKEHQMNLLINDCKDYLDAGNLAQANLVFKEIKLHYEKYSKELKAKVYKDAILVFNEINKKFFEKVLEDIASKKESHTKESLERKKCLLVNSYNALDNTSKEKYKANYDYLINLMNKVL